MTKPTVIEQTAKRHKATQALGLAAFAAGMFLTIVCGAWDMPTATGLSLVLMLVGLIVYGVGLLRAWWHHG